MSEYTYDQISESFYAVQAFLQFKDFNVNNYNTIKCEFSFKNPNRSYTHNIETESKELLDEPSFILNSDAFKSEGYYKPVWSSFNLFSWDENSEELTVELNNKKIIIKHI